MNVQGSGRRKRVSARHQVKRLDRISEDRAFKRSPNFQKPVRQKKRVLLRSVRVSLTTRNFYRAERPGMKSGPDVFADALVPSGRIHPPGAPVSRSAIFPETYRFDGRAARHLARQSLQFQCVQFGHHGSASRTCAGLWRLREAAR